MVKRHYGIVNKDFKLIHFYYDVDEWELYDRKNDPNEMNNVYNDPDYSDVVIKLTQDLKEIRIKYKDSDFQDRLKSNVHDFYTDSFNGWNLIIDKSGSDIEIRAYKKR